VMQYMAILVSTDLTRVARPAILTCFFNYICPILDRTSPFSKTDLSVFTSQFPSTHVWVSVSRLSTYLKPSERRRELAND
jgi:hypothetical protein